ncbi:hypothetical protein SAMN04489859_10374 [Paracoccus alcaliphilus]|uniref:Uncharacterized protein n=1 Tax=Paracoccus alcaliphilus TaxID=34002 RepID=A0A1H8M7N5_9RHOB|nr:hypothetical protein SAMN04489859_10374 [Paracoccus alcaliphilus]
MLIFLYSARETYFITTLNYTEFVSFSDFKHLFLQENQWGRIFFLSGTHG